MSAPGSRSSVYGTNAPAILAQGYEDYVQNTVTNDGDGWWYSFTVTVSNFDDFGHALVRIGDQAVVLARPGSGSASATFLLEQGRRYDLYVSPADNAAYAPSEPSAVIVPPTAAGAGSVTVAPTGLGVDPSTWHSSVSGGPQSFSATCHHAHPGLGAWSWTCADPTVHIDMPSNSAVVVRWDWANVSWKQTNVVVTWTASGHSFLTNLWISCGTNNDPQVAIGLSVPPHNCVWLNSNDDNDNSIPDLQEPAPGPYESDLRPLVVSFGSDIRTNGILTLSYPGGGTRLRFWSEDIGDDAATLPKTWDVDSWSAAVSPIRTS